MARPKTIYVRDQDVGTWEEAAKVAADGGVSMSEYVAAAIRDRLAREAGGYTEMISVETFDAIGRYPIAFEGRWIIRDAQSSAPGFGKQDAWSIAVTKHGRFLWHVRRADGTPGGPGTKDTLAEFEQDLVPPDVIDAAAQELQRDGYVVWRDI